MCERSGSGVGSGAYCIYLWSNEPCYCVVVSTLIAKWRISLMNCSKLTIFQTNQVIIFIAPTYILYLNTVWSQAQRDRMLRRYAAADQWAHKPRALCQLRTIPATKTHRLNITRYAPMSDRKLQAFSAEPRTTAEEVSGGHFGSFKPDVNFKCFFFHPKLSSATDCCIVIVVDIDIFSKTGMLVTCKVFPVSSLHSIYPIHHLSFYH